MGAAIRASRRLRRAAAVQQVEHGVLVAVVSCNPGAGTHTCARRACFSVGEENQTCLTVPWGTSLKSHSADSGPEIISRCFVPVAVALRLAVFRVERLHTSARNQYPHNCGAIGPRSPDQTPALSLLHLDVGSPSQLP